jgi:exopolyphosphatase/guanosine-5'-triphosphate,3'-diphosphate pyrophosphatase
VTRVAVADLGTNSTRLLIADVAGSGSIEEVERLLTITRLGEGVDERRLLGEAPRRRVLDTLERYAARADQHGAGPRLAVATSAVRDAANRDAFLAEVAATGFRPQLLSGSEEARATFSGVLSARRRNREGTVVIDVGGGSTEIVLGGPGGVHWARSFDVGCVRMTERFLGEDRIEPAARAACRAALDEVLAAIPDDVVAATEEAVGVAGTVTTLAALDLDLPGYDAERIDGHRLSRTAVAEWEDRLCGMDLATRRALPAMEEGRAPVICGGVIVLGAAMDRLDLDTIDVSERDILHGAALLAAERE